MKPPIVRGLHAAWAVFGLALGTAPPPAPGCNVPVFRYALERWPSDPYQLLVFHEGGLSEESAARIAALRAESLDGSGLCNFHVTLADLADTNTAPLRATWEAQKQPAARLPWAVLRAPLRREGPASVWSGSLADADPARLLDSPARSKLVKRLCAGESAVWVLVTSGKKSQDGKALKVLTSTLQQMEKEMELPEGIGEPGSEVVSDVPLQIKFSVLKVARDDPAELPFLNMLFGGEAELAGAKGPAAFVVFGRARVLGGIGAEELTPELVMDASAMLCGPCSCQMKEMNPGYDLLARANWDALITGELSGPHEMPPLKGFSEFAAAAPPVAADAPAGAGTASSSAGPVSRVSLARWIGIVIGAAVLLLGAASAFILRSRKF